MVVDGREPLVWLDRADPAETRERVLASDPLKSELSDLLAVWYEALGNSSVTLNEIRVSAQEGDDKMSRLHDLLVGMLVGLGRSEWNARSIGWKLKSYEGRIVCGLSIRNTDDKAASGNRWQVIKMA